MEEYIKCIVWLFDGFHRAKAKAYFHRFGSESMQAGYDGEKTVEHTYGIVELAEDTTHFGNIGKVVK